ncbi:hypothetical protein V2J09_004425 [Rumex salicifolius]
MNPNPYQYQSNPLPPPLPPTWYPPLPPNPPPSSSFWTNPNFHDRLMELHDTFSLAKSMKKELETLIKAKESNESAGTELSKFLEGSRIDFGAQEKISLEAASGLMSKLRFVLEPFRAIVDAKCPWEEKSSVARLGEKMKKSKRNKLWRKKKRKRVAQMLAKEAEQFDLRDREADEWRAREIAKETAQQKVQKMKEIAKQKAKEERKKLEEEDDKFIDRVRAAVEEEERQARAAADTDAAKDAIATAEASRQAMLSASSESKDQVHEAEKGSKEQISQSGSSLSSTPVASKDAGKEGSDRQSKWMYDYVSSLPQEFYHYYHGSSTDMGTLIEVRRSWDAYIQPGGSRIPGHWVQPAPPSNEVWASYLVRPK